MKVKDYPQSRIDSRGNGLNKDVHINLNVWQNTLSVLVLFPIIENIEAEDATGRGGGGLPASVTWPELSVASAVRMRAEILGFFSFLTLLTHCQGSPAQCNTTSEFGHNTQLSLQSPKQRTGASLVCWYSLQIIEGSGLEVFQIHVNRFR